MKDLSFVTAFLLLCALPLRAQDTAGTARDTIYYFPPVIVSPTEARMRETPVSFSDLTRKHIQERYSDQDIPVLLSELPSITYYSESGSGIGYNYINLRGFDQRRLSVMINGVPQNDPEDHNVYWIDFPDLMASAGDIQVQRGAGSAFYGPPAIGGSVNLVTNPFGRKPGITLEAIAGFQQFGDSAGSLLLNTRKYAVSVNSGLIDRTYMLYGRLGTIRSDGYRTNSWVDLNSYFLGALRLDGSMTTRLHFFGGPLTDGLAYMGLPKFTGDDNVLRRSNWGDWNADSTQVSYSPAMRRVVSADGRDTVYVVPRRNQESESFSQPHYELLNDWKISPAVTLSNTLFYYAGAGYYDYDASWADTSMLRIGYRYGIPTTQNPANALVRAFVGNKQWGWLPHVEIDQGDGTLTLGAEIRIHRSTHWGKIQYAEGLPADYNPDYHFYEYNGEKDILSAYAHELFRPAADITLMGDLQVVRDRYGIANEKYLGHNFSYPYLFVNPRLGINYNIDEAWNSYCSIAYTSREPVLRNLYAAEDSYFGATPQFAADTAGGVVRYDFTAPLAKPEHLLDLEAGANYQSSGARFSADVFWMEFADELIKSGQVDIFGEPVTGNADRTRHIGIEADGSVTFMTTFTLSGNISLSQNRLVRHREIVQSYDSLGSAVLTTYTLDNNPIAGFPDVLWNIRLTYRDDDVTASLLAKYVGSFYTDNFKNENNKNDAYTVFDGELLYRFPAVAGVALTARGEVRNLFNNRYFMNGEGDAFFPAAERNFILGLSVSL